jgi:predicted O-linked N-acetylglucosamine transferase (SPINDLY family)
MKNRFIQITINKTEQLLKDGFTGQALSVLNELHAIYPDSFEVSVLLIPLLIEQGDYDNAHRLLAGLEIVASQKHGDALFKIGNLFAVRGRFSEAAAAYERAISANGLLAGAYNNLGLTMMELGRPEPAYNHLTRALELYPDYAETHNNLGNLCVLLFKMEKAIAHFKRAIELKPNYATAYSNLGRAYRLCGEVDESIALIRTALELEPNERVLIDNFLFSLIYTDSAPESVFQEHVRLVSGAYAAAASTLPPEKYTHDKIRIGYISGDFRDHPVALFFEPMLLYFDRNRFDIYCYSQVVSEDGISQRLKRAGGVWRTSVGLKAEDLAKLIRNDEIDILVDLAGFTENHRLDVCALKPAPVQCSWLGYPCSTGLRQMDYRITDACADPPGMTERFHSEQLIRLPHSFICYTPDRSIPLQQLPAGPIVFCCFNNLSKISDILLSAWSRILDAIPDSRIKLKYAFLADNATRTIIQKRLTKQGIDPTRVELRGFTETKREHLEFYGQCHIALDTYPYHGTTTTCEALWMGVPVVSVAGKSHVSRVGVSILYALGLPELSTTTFDDYINVAVELARDRNRLRLLRQSLRTRMESSALVDSRGFVSDMESAFEQMIFRMPVAGHIQLPVAIA